MPPRKPAVFHEVESLQAFADADGDLKDCVIQGIDVSFLTLLWKKIDVRGTIFLGCSFDQPDRASQLAERGAIIFPSFPDLPYHPYRPALYTREELMEGYTPVQDESLDKRIYDHFVSSGRNQPHIMEALAQRMHDHAIDDALRDLLAGKNDGVSKKVVGIMGGHGTPRTDPSYRQVVLTARGLARAGYFVASGGGPGTMEAANLGAYLASVSDSEIDEVLALLAKAPVYTDEGYLAAAQSVLDRYPDGESSLAVPTWFYGHEPSNLFSIHIAKYFSNSIREDGLLAVSTYGVVFAPGSAGTTQEIFMDAAQNHYKTFGDPSPMIFLGRHRYEEETQLFPLLKDLAKGTDYARFLCLTDDPGEVVQSVRDFEATRASS
ncbi:MAG: hypothetical protein AAF514_09240 [Verrucomicrobiota bacterium]